jgi:hypothetical protein
VRRLLFLILAWPAGLAAQAPAPATVANSPLQWEVREGKHPRMGPIVVAVPNASVITAVGKERIASLVFFSCERSKGRIAIELANAPESDAKSGLFPKQMPRLFCNPRSSAPRVELKTTWFVSELGDALARDIPPSELRRCASVDVEQDLALPRGWVREVQHIDIEIIPYKKELDVVLSACAEPAPALAAAPTPAPPVAAPPPVVKPAPPPAEKAVPPPIAKAAPPVTAPPVVAEAPWRPARVIATGRTNVRAAANIASPIVVQLDPGALVLVQKTANEWWRAKPRSGAAFSGYIREDRLNFN